MHTDHYWCYDHKCCSCRCHLRHATSAKGWRKRPHEQCEEEVAMMEVADDYFA